MVKILQFESKQEKFIILGVIGILILIGGLILYPAIEGYFNKDSEKIIGYAASSINPSKTPEEYYDMFKCSCCGESIATQCCDMAKERRLYVNKLVSEGLGEDEIVYQMVKKFGFSILMDPSRGEKVKEYIKSQASDNPSKIEIEPQKYNFGIVSQKDGIVSTIFTVKNTGGSDLVIDNMETSCMCTTASLIYKEVEGPKFGMSMHGGNPENYKLVIPPGDSAQLKVYYDPMAHGKQKEPEARIVREITVVSNDPVDFQKNVRIEVTQVP